MRVTALLLASTLAVPAVAEQPLRVTSDSAAYCSQLHMRVVADVGAQAGLRSLADEGLRLCDSGQPRLGIAKLRRALRSAQALGT
jgi:hypothetical protein